MTIHQYRIRVANWKHVIVPVISTRTQWDQTFTMFISDTRFRRPTKCSIYLSGNCAIPQNHKAVRCTYSHIRKQLPTPDLSWRKFPETISPCDPNPCLNGGTCEEDDCSKSKSSKCKSSGGKSKRAAKSSKGKGDDDEDYICICPPGYTGDHCEER